MVEPPKFRCELILQIWIPHVFVTLSHADSVLYNYIEKQLLTNCSSTFTLSAIIYYYCQLLIYIIVVLELCYVILIDIKFYRMLLLLKA